MARRKQYKRSASKRSTLPETTINPGPERQVQLTRVNAGELVNSSPARMTPVRKRTRTPQTSAVALSASKKSIATGNVRSAPLVESSAPVAYNGAETKNSFFKNGNLNALAISVSIFMVLFVIIFCLLPLKKINYLMPIAYQDVETYTVREPYLDTITYTEREPYTVMEAYTVNEPYYTTEPYVHYDRRPMPPPTDNVTPPPPPPEPMVYYRQVVNYIPVTKYKEVTKYRDVTKTKYEIKYRTVEKQITVSKVKQEPMDKMVPILYYLMAERSNPIYPTYSASL